jgi:hypothetical protein
MNKYRNFIADDPWNNCCSGMMMGADGTQEPVKQVNQPGSIALKLLVLAGLIGVSIFAYKKFVK